MFYFDEIEGKKVLKSDFLNDVDHFFTTRELPLTKGSLDIEKICIQNRETVAKYLELNTLNLISPTQSHTSNITVAQKTRTDYADIDALVLSSKNLAIFLNFADCVPVMLWDSENNIGAIAHAGWRGTADWIVPKTVSFMRNYYESDPKDIIAVIGPSISMDNYQVDEEVCQKLMSTLQNRPDDCWKLSEEAKKYNVDLKKINYHQLNQSGVHEIDMCGYCTYDTNDIFFSYRKENGNTARHSAVMKLSQS